MQRLSVYAHKQNPNRRLGVHTHVYDLYTMILSVGTPVHELLINKINGLVFDKRVISNNMRSDYVTVPEYLEMLQSQTAFPTRKNI